MSRNEQIVNPDAEILDEEDLGGLKNKNLKTTAVWAYYIPSFDYLSLVRAATEEDALPRAVARTLRTHPVKAAPTQIKIPFVAQETFLVRTTAEIYRDQFDGVLFAGALNPNSVTRTFELIMGRRSDWRKNEQRGINFYRMHLLRTLERPISFPIDEDFIGFDDTE